MIRRSLFGEVADVFETFQSRFQVKEITLTENDKVLDRIQIANKVYIDRIDHEFDKYYVYYLDGSNNSFECPAEYWAVPVVMVEGDEGDEGYYSTSLRAVAAALRFLILDAVENIEKFEDERLIDEHMLKAGRYTEIPARTVIG